MPQPKLRCLRRHTRSLLVTIYYFLLHVSVITLLFALLLRHGELSRAMEYSTVSPAHKAIAHEITSTWPYERNHHAEYSGPPSLANNRAWDELTRPIFFNVSKKEIVAAGESVEDSVQLEDSSYLASTQVFHDVHCLRQIRLFIYKDTYYPNVTKSQERYLLRHIDYCIEALRLSVMCTGDVSLYTFFWHDPPREKPGTKTNAQ